MLQKEKIFVAGHRGLIGSAILRKLQMLGCSNILVAERKALDLSDQRAVFEFIASERPTVVVLAAARVGGIIANSRYPADFFEENISIQQNVISAARKNDVTKLLFFGSNCAYPANIPMPLAEKALLDGAPEITNRSFAIAKVAGVEYCRAVNQQFGHRYFCVVPASTFGPADNFDPEHSHVIAGLIRRMHEAKIQNRPFVTVWGSGTPIREFIFSDDVAEATTFLLSEIEDSWERLFPVGTSPIINVGSGRGITIKELAEKIKRTLGYQGELHYDSSRPDGVSEKILDISRISQLSWTGPSTELEVGLKISYQDYLDRFGQY